MIGATATSVYLWIKLRPIVTTALNFIFIRLPLANCILESGCKIQRQYKTCFTEQKDRFYPTLT